MPHTMREKYRDCSYADLLSAIEEKNIIPQHIAVIMDGNGRWAQKQGLPRYRGHEQGVERIRDILQACGDLKIKYLTLYTFSTENWRRPQEEVGFLMQLIHDTIKKEYQQLHRNNIRVRILGELGGLPTKIRQGIQQVVSSTRKNDALTLNLALNYGGRAEILQAVQELYKELPQRNKGLEIDEELFASYLYTAGLPDPELLIRTGGERRLSNFLLWQLAYAEFVVSETYWPDFSQEEFCLSILDYQRRERRFGGIKNTW